MEPKAKMESRAKLIEMITGVATRNGYQKVLAAMLDQMSASSLSRLSTQLAEHFNDCTDEAMKFLSIAIPRSTESQRLRALERARGACNGENPHLLRAIALQTLAGLVQDEQ